MMFWAFVFLYVICVGALAIYFGRLANKQDKTKL